VSVTGTEQDYAIGPAKIEPDGVGSQGVSGTAPTVVGWLGLGAIVGLSALLSLLLILAPAHAAADVTHYKYWARLVTLEGISGAYSGEYPVTAAIYPPVTMYGYWLAGLVYQAFFDPAFTMEAALGSRGLTALVKLVAVVPHLATIVAIFIILVRRYGQVVALVASAAYGLNPAALFDLAYWGQPDSVHALFLLLAIWCFERDRPVVGWALVGLAAATKPQAWALLPLLIYVSLRRFGLGKSVTGGLSAGLAAGAVCFPYLAYGTLGDLLKLPRLIAETMPVASANAHNVWWLVTDARPEFVFDDQPLVGDVTYRQVAMILALGFLAFALWRTNVFSRDGGLMAMGAYVAFGWFMVTTRAHENHDFFVLPMLVVAAARSRFLVAVFVAISVTLFLNMTFHDFSLTQLRESIGEPELWVPAQLANAGLNVLVLLVWSALVAGGAVLGARRLPTLPRWRAAPPRGRRRCR
jgi:hypothetical protein